MDVREPRTTSVSSSEGGRILLHDFEQEGRNWRAKGWMYSRWMMQRDLHWWLCFFTTTTTTTLILMDKWMDIQGGVEREDEDLIWFEDGFFFLSGLEGKRNTKKEKRSASARTEQNRRSGWVREGRTLNKRLWLYMNPAPSNLFTSNHLFSAASKVTGLRKKKKNNNLSFLHQYNKHLWLQLNLQVTDFF